MLRGSVGLGGNNLPNDVIVVKQLLNRSIIENHQVVLELNSGVGPELLQAIRRFQEQEALEIVDGRVDPYGATIQRLAPPRFENPTDGRVRGTDLYGSGAFGASRDGGKRRHKGVDYVARPGQEVKAPVNGVVSREVLPYRNDSRFNGLEVIASDGTKVQLFYLSPKTAILNTYVDAGDVIGRSVSLSIKYPGITEHIHVQIFDRGARVLDPTRLIRSSSF